MQLSSDAEWYAAALMRSTDPPLIAADQSQPLDIRPAGERALTTVLARAGQALGIDVLDWSVIISIAALLVFVAGVYVAVRVAAGPTEALIVAGASIVSVHALGGATYGFQPLGFLPRDLMLGPALLLIAMYGVALRRGTAALAGVFFLCGLAANLYPVLFAHLALTLLGAELLRRRRIALPVLAFGAAAALGAAPAAVDVLSRSLVSTPVDVEVLRLRHDYQIVESIPLAVTQYLRRTIVYAGLIAALWWLMRRHLPIVARSLGPWFALAASSLALSLVGVLLESARPELIRYLISRTSVFFIFASMVICCVGIRSLVSNRWPRSGPAAGVVAVLAIFALQSAAPSVVRGLVDTRTHLADRLAFHSIAQEVRALTSPDDVLIAPSDEVPDLAASLRTYARRPVWQTYKDLGVAQVDGIRARRGFERWTEMHAVLAGGDVDQIVEFMRANGIRAAVVPVSLLPADALERPELAARVDGYAVVLAP